MTTDLEKEREAFEAWAKQHYGYREFSLEPFLPISDHWRGCWAAWQAGRAALAAPAAPQSVPSFNARQISLKQRGAKIVLTLELDAIEGAPQYIVTPVNPAVVRQAAPQEQPGDEDRHG